MRRRLGRIAAAALAACLLLTLTGCGRPERRSRVWYTWFDTVTTLVGEGSEKDFETAAAIVEDTLERYHRLCDIYYEYSGLTNARTLNLHAGEKALAVDRELLAVLRFGKEMHELTDGRCSILLGAPLALWHDCRETALNGGAAELPDLRALAEAGEHCRIGDLELTETTARIADPEARLDLGAVAKGFAAEQAARALEAAGCTGFALSVGGNVRTVGGKADGSDWVTGIQDPDDTAGSVYGLRVSLRDAALVTSGSYQRYYEVDGVRYHHILDPDTLFPRNEFLSVSILCPDSGRADALSTAVFNLPLSDGLAFVNALADTEACWILADGETVFSDGFEEYILQ